MPLNQIEINHLNKMNRSAQDPLLGNMLASLETSSSGIYSGSSVQSNLNSHSDSTGSFVHGLGTISTQSASAVNLTGGFINGVKYGTATSYSAFESDGTLYFTGSATIWDDLVMPLTQTKVGANLKPDFDFDNIGYLFPQNDKTEILYLVFQMPHGWKEGSGIEPHVHWRQNANQNPVFKIDYKWFNIGGIIPNSFQTFVMNNPEFTYTSGSLQQLSTGSILLDGTGKTISSLLTAKLYREDNDYTGDVLAYHFDVHVEKDTFGSRKEYEK